MNLMEIAQSLRMYLVQENGPTKLVLEDPEHNKYRVQIGSEVSCSCGGGKEEHCAHTVSVKDGRLLTGLDLRAD
jgi:transcription elongation GreA/GreB family factor